MRTLFALLAALLVAAPARAEVPQAELDRLLAPIALYPDALLSQVLMASTYPLDVVEAARWTREHPGLHGEETVRAAQEQDWDPSVKSLVAFPDLLARMDQQLAWTRQLGEVFLAEESRVMDTVQQLRRRAQANGHLLADGRLRSIDDGRIVIIEYADPGVVYVPYYDPWVVYGGWWWPAHPPVAWVPWPGWSASVIVATGFFFGGVDWRHRHVKVVHVHSPYLRPRTHARAHRPLHVGKWQHVPSERRHFRRYDERPAPLVARRQPMPPALSTTPAPLRYQAPRLAPRAVVPQRPAQPPRAIPYDRGHGRAGRTVDRADGGRRARADAPQYRAAQPHRFARDAGRNAGPVSVRPAVRPGMAGGGPRMAR